MTLDHLSLGLPVALVIWFGFLRRVGPLDFWWHLKAGQIIVTTKSIPRVDLFTFTCAGKPFILQNWLVDVIYYGAHRAGGLALVIALNTALLVAALLPVYHLCWRAGGRVRVAVASALLPALALLTFGNVRSQAFSFVFFATTYWIVLTHLSRHRSVLWVLPLMMIGWVNLHGAFVLGLALIGLVLASESIRPLFHGPSGDTSSARDLRPLAYALALSMVATLVSPEGLRAYSSVTAVTQDPVSQSFVTEWQTPRLDGVGILGFYGPVVLTVLVVASSEVRPDLTEIVLLIAFVALGVTALRNAIWFVLVSTPIVARHLAATRATTLRRILGMGRDPAEVRTPIRHRLNAIVAASMLALAVLLSPWVRALLSPDRDRSLLDPSTPVGAVDYMEAHRLRGPTFSPESYGDYLVWRLWPMQRSFVDSRVHLFRACLDVANDYNLLFFDRRWEERLARYDIRYLLLERADALSRPLIDDARVSPRWQLLYEDDLSVLFEKKTT